MGSRRRYAVPRLIASSLRVLSTCTRLSSGQSLGYSLGYDPLIATRNKHRELPPLKKATLPQIGPPLGELPPIELRSDQLPSLKNYMTVSILVFSNQDTRID